MSAALACDQLPASTLDLLLSMFTADPGAGTARGWADEMLTAGVSSEAALAELALLGDHESHRVAALLPRAIRDAGIETEPRGRLLLLFYRLLLHAWLDGQVEVGGFALLLGTCLAREPGTGGIGADGKDALNDLMRTLALYRACCADREGCPTPVEEGDVAAVARTAFARLSA